jgi:hypothetical protein
MLSEFRLRGAPQNASVVQSILASALCAFAFLHAVGSAATAVTIPAPREQPSDRSSTLGTNAEPSPCQLRLHEIAVFRPSPPITGPGECTASDVVAVDAVLLPDTHRVAILPPVTLRCPMAEAVAHWIRDDVAPMIVTLGTSLRAVETLGSFDCRGRNGITGAKISEHGRANALDVRSLKLADGTAIELNDVSITKSLREKLRQSACARFSTVLGNGADAYHESHVHLDLIERSNNYNICLWDVLNAAEAAALATKKAAVAPMGIPVITSKAGDVPSPRPHPERSTRGAENNGKALTIRDAMRAPISFSVATLLTTSVLAEPPSQGKQAVAVGPWTIATAYKADKFDSCSMSRTAGDLGISFVRTEAGLQLQLDSPKWKLDRGKAYTVRLVAESRSVEGKALAESKSVTVPLVDAPFNKRLRTAEVLEVRGEGAMLRVPLDGSTAALERLDACFEKNSSEGSETNPFVAPSRKP